MSSNTLTPILKSSEVEISGKIVLEIDHAGSCASGTAAAVREMGETIAKVIETTASYATIELTCGCGTKSYIQCNYVKS